MPSTEILLVNLTTHCNNNPNTSYSAPLGLYCLAGEFPDKISVVDKKVNILDETLVLLSENIKSIICLLPQNINKETLESFCLEIKNNSPKIKIGLNRYIPNYEKYADFIDNGTGRNTILRLLRGEQIQGIVNPTNDELVFLPFYFDSSFQDNGYELTPEKMITAKTLEIFKPWLGLQERNTDLNILPSANWINNLLLELKKASFTSFHFILSDFNNAIINELTILLKPAQIKFAIPYSHSTKIDTINFNNVCSQIWFYYPNNIENLPDKILEIKKIGFEPCLLINKNTKFDNLDFLENISRLVIEDEEDWNEHELKEFIKQYWWKGGRFFKRLFSLRHAAELVAFTKSSYKMLDIIIGKDEK